MQMPLYVNLDRADILITGIDAFIIRKNEVSERLSSFKNCLSRVRGTEREASVYENIKKLELSNTLDFKVPELFKRKLTELNDYIFTTEIVNKLRTTEDGKMFTKLLEETAYIISNDIIYTKLVNVKFKSLYNTIARQINNTHMGHELLRRQREVNRELHKHLQELEVMDTFIYNKLMGIETAIQQTEMEVLLSPTIGTLENRVEILTNKTDECLKNYYAKLISSKEAQDLFKGLILQLGNLKSLIPLGAKNSTNMLTGIDQRLNVCQAALVNIGFIDSARRTVDLLGERDTTIVIEKDTIIHDHEQITAIGFNGNEVVLVEDNELQEDSEIENTEIDLSIVEFKPK